MDAGQIEIHAGGQELYALVAAALLAGKWLARPADSLRASLAISPVIVAPATKRGTAAVAGFASLVTARHLARSLGAKVRVRTVPLAGCAPAAAIEQEAAWAICQLLWLPRPRLLPAFAQFLSDDDRKALFDSAGSPSKSALERFSGLDRRNFASRPSPAGEIRIFNSILRAMRAPA